MLHLRKAPQPRSNTWKPFKLEDKLLKAIIAHDVETLCKQLNSGIDPNELEADELPLVIACELGDPALVELLLKHKADPNKRPSNGERDALSTMCYLTGETGEVMYKEHLECAELLLKYGANINSRDMYQKTPLMVAAGCDNDVFIEWLVEHGADVHATDDIGWTAMDHSWFSAYEISGWPLTADSHGHEIRDVLGKAGCVACKASLTDETWTTKKCFY